MSSSTKPPASPAATILGAGHGSIEVGTINGMVAIRISADDCPEQLTIPLPAAEAFEIATRLAVLAMERGARPSLEKVEAGDAVPVMTSRTRGQA